MTLTDVVIDIHQRETGKALAEDVALLLGWRLDHPGEYDAIDLPRLGFRIFLSHEAISPTTRRGGSTYQVSRLRPDS